MKEVIIKNEFLCNNAIIEYVVPKTIKIVESTAFSYCENLEQIIFEGENTDFGKFPIIECNRLKSIIVPAKAISYYKNKLSYYKDIIKGDVIDEIYESKELEVDKCEKIECNDEVRKETQEEAENKCNQRKCKRDIDVNILLNFIKYCDVGEILILLEIFLENIEDKNSVNYQLSRISHRLIWKSFEFICEDNLSLGKDSILCKTLIQYKQYQISNIPFNKLSIPVFQTLIKRWNILYKDCSLYSICGNQIIFDEDWVVCILLNKDRLLKSIDNYFLKLLAKNNDGLKLLKYKLRMKSK